VRKQIKQELARAHVMPIKKLSHPCAPHNYIWAFQLVLGAAITVLIAHSVYTFLRNKDAEDDPAVREEKIRAIVTGLDTVGILAWPLVWEKTVGFGTLAHHPATIFPFLWPMVMIASDMALTNSDPQLSANGLFGLQNLQNDSASMINLALAAGALLTAQYSSALSEASAPLMMYALLVTISFVVPSPNLDPQTEAGIVLGKLQRIAFNYAVGLVGTGIISSIVSRNNRVPVAAK